MLRLAVFLGNPGPEYQRSRHNAGRLLAARLPFYSNLSWTKKFKGRFASCDLELMPPAFSPSVTPCFLIPETYMNLSGEAAGAAALFFKLKPEEIIVVHDELELPLGFVSFKFDGGLGGHNGLRSIKQRLGTAAFWRLRIGIGRPPGRLPGEGGPPEKGVHAGGAGEVAAWVLSNFTPAEEPLISPALAAAAAALTAAFAEGPERLLPEWKKKQITGGE